MAQSINKITMLSGRRLLNIVGWSSAMLAIIVIMAACAHTDKEPPKDPFFEKWKTMSETALGASPTPRVRAIDPNTDQVIEARQDAEMQLAAPEEDLVPDRPLPTQPVTLRMKDSHVGVVLRAIARGAGQNLLINSGVTGFVSVDVKKVPWNEVFLSILNSQGLRYTWEGDIIRIQTTQDMEKDLQVRQVQERTRQQKIVAQTMEPLIMKVVKIDYADPEFIMGPVRAVLSASTQGGQGGKDGKAVSTRGSVELDKQSSSLVLLAVRGDMERMLSLINTLDQPPYQVHIKANIVEATADTARQLGVQWGWMYGRHDSLADDVDLWITPGGNAGSTGDRDSPLTGSYTPATSVDGVSGQGNAINFPAALEETAGAALGLMFGKVGSNILEIQLSALAKDNKINILSTPSITTLDNQTAFTENGTEVPYVTINEDGEREVKFKDATLKLEITPHVIDTTQMRLKVEVKKDEVDQSRDVQGNPFIIKKRTQTNLIVRNGETIVISGLTKTRKTGGESGIPWLKDVPGLGYLFKGESKGEAMEEVLIFLTPTVLPKFGISGSAAAHKARTP